MGMGRAHWHDPATSYSLRGEATHGEKQTQGTAHDQPHRQNLSGMEGSQAWAVFLKANKDSKFHTRRSHMAVMNLPLVRVKSQSVADQSKMVIGTVGKLGGKPLADSVGVWSLSDYDMRVVGVQGDGTGVRRTKNLANLDAIVNSVSTGSQFKSGILSNDPRPYGIVARLRIPKGATITGIVEDNNTRTFQPGGHQQVLADFIRVSIPFATPSKGPTLRLKRFGAKTGQSFKFQARGADLTVTMSNLCRCVEQTEPQTPSGTVSEDREFVVYYKLLRRALPANRRPVPQVPVSTKNTSGIDVPECYRPGEINF